MIDTRFALIRPAGQQLSRQLRTDGLPPVWSDPVYGPQGRFAIRHASTTQQATRQKPAPQKMAAPAATPKPAEASPQKLAAMRAALRQAVREDMALNATPAPPAPPAAPPAKGGFASRIRIGGGSFNAFKKKALAPAA